MAEASAPSVTESPPALAAAAADTESLTKEAEPMRPAGEATPPPRARRSWRGRLFGWLYPVADYVRRFSQAQVTASLEDWRGHADARQIELLERIRALSEAQAQLLERMALLPQRDAEVLNGMSALAHRLEETTVAVERRSDQLGASAAASQQLLAELATRADAAWLAAGRRSDEVAARLEAATAAANRRSDEVAARVDAAAAAANRRSDEVAARVDAAAAAADRRSDEIRARIDAGSAATERRLLELGQGRDGAETLIKQLTDELRRSLNDVGIRQSGHSAVLAELTAQLQATHSDVAGLLALAGPRFDELEIKVRPLIAFDDDSYAVRVADGYAMTPRSEPTLTLMIANAPSGGLESGTRRVLQALIEPGMRVADVGANIGLLTLACARATGPTGRVWAFEPEPGPRAQLEKTATLNGLSWVVIDSTAVGDAHGQASFHVSPVIGHSSLYALPAEEEAKVRMLEVEVAPLDELVPLGAPLDVVKIDVEGAELDVLRGMEGHLTANPDIALIAEFGPSHLARIGTRPRDWWDAFRAQGFRAYAIEEPHGACRPVSLKEALQYESLNIAFVRPRSRAQARLPRA